MRYIRCPNCDELIPARERDRQRMRREAAEARCDWCRAIFVQHHSGHRFCSRRCQLRARHQ